MLPITLYASYRTTLEESIRTLDELSQILAEFKAEVGGVLMVCMRDVGHQPFCDNPMDAVEVCEEETQRGKDGRYISMPPRIVLM